MQTQTPQPNINLPKHTHKILWSVLGILLLVVIVGSVYWWKAEKETEQSNLETSNKEQEISTPDWKTYGNAEYGFEFKYPKEWPNLKSTSAGVEGSETIYLCLPTSIEDYTEPDCGQTHPGYARAFYIDVFTDDVWAENQEQETNRSIYVASDDKYVFGYGVGQDTVTDIYPTNEIMSQILSTFKFTK